MDASLDSWDEFLKALHRYGEANIPVAMVTLVHLQGSSYKGLGARMLVDPNGQTTGTISGGCLEADVALHGQQVLATAQPKIVTYDSRSDEDLIWGLGLGCEGLIQLLIQPLRPLTSRRLTQVLQPLVFQRKTAILTHAWHSTTPEDVTVLGTRIYTPDLIAADGFENHTNLDWLDQKARELWAEADRSFAPKTHCFSLENSSAEHAMVLCQPIVPAPELLVCGGGFDTPPLLRLAAFAGWSTLLALPKSPPQHQTWPGNPKLIIGEPKALLEKRSVSKRTLVILKSHHFFTDLAYLKALLPSQAPYMGLLGPKRRTLRLFDELQKEGITISESDLQRLFFPVGLDIGAETSEEIALAIFAEMRAFLADRKGGSLKFRQGPIHQR